MIAYCDLTPFCNSIMCTTSPLRTINSILPFNYVYYLPFTYNVIDAIPFDAIIAQSVLSKILIIDNP